MKYGVILADPPWQYDAWKSVTAQGLASTHYATAGVAWISALPVASVAAPDCCLFLWGTSPCLPDALSVIRGWGFEYKTVAFAWVKTIPLSDRARVGLGMWTRSNAELCLLATRGKPRRLNKGIEQIIACPIGAHSSKPDEVYDRIERLVSGPYLELFARPRGALFPLREGWTQIGNEITGNDILLDLERLALE